MNQAHSNKVEIPGVPNRVVEVGEGVVDHAVEISKVVVARLVEVVVVVAVEISVIELKMVHKRTILGNKHPSMFAEPWRTPSKNFFLPRANFDSNAVQSNRDYEQEISPTERPFEADNTRRLNNRGHHRGGRSYRGEGGEEDYRANRRQYDRQPRSFVSYVILDSIDQVHVLLLLFSFFIGV